MDTKNVRYYYVSNYVGATGVAQGSQLQTYDDLSDGEVLVVNAENTAVDSGSVNSDTTVAQSGVKIAFRSGDNLYYTPLIKSDNLLSYIGVSNSVEQEQISYIGYDGSGNSIDTIANNSYSPWISFWKEGRQGFTTPHLTNTLYTSGDNPTQLDVALNVADGLQASLNHGTTTGKAKLVKTEVVCSDSGTNLTSTTGTITVTKGSKWISADSNIDGEASVGDLFRAGTSTTDGVYKIVSMDTTNDEAKLDRPYEGDSGTFTATNSQYISASNASSADFGIKLTGVTLPFNDPKTDVYQKVRFEVNVDGFGETSVTDSQSALRGIGNYKDVAEAEFLYQGVEGNAYRGYKFWSQARTDATSGNTYNLLTIRFYNDQETSAVSYVRSPIEITLALKTGYSSNESPDTVIDTLDTYFGYNCGLSA